MGKAMIPRKLTGTLRKTAHGSGVLSEDYPGVARLDVTGIGFRPSVVAAWQRSSTNNTIQGACIYFAKEAGDSLLSLGVGGKECWVSDDEIRLLFYTRPDSIDDEPVYWIAIE